MKFDTAAEVIPSIPRKFAFFRFFYESQYKYKT